MSLLDNLHTFNFYYRFLKTINLLNHEHQDFQEFVIDIVITVTVCLKCTVNMRKYLPTPLILTQLTLEFLS